MPANAAAWFMAKRKFYMNQPLEQQLLPFLLKKYPEKFQIKRNQVAYYTVLQYILSFDLVEFRLLRGATYSDYPKKV